MKLKATLTKFIALALGWTSVSTFAATPFDTADELSPLYMSTAVPAKKPLGDDQAVEVILPKDRCKAGIIKFGRWKCTVLGRGTTQQARPSGTLSSWNSDERTYWKQGTQSNGQACYYISQWNTSGATPASTYTLWLDGKRPGLDGQPDPNASYGSNNIGCIEPVNGTDSIYGRTALRVHSGRADRPDFESRYTHGCVRINANCQHTFNDWLKEPPRRAIDHTLDQVVSGCGTPERSLNFTLREVIDPASLEDE